MDTFRGQRIESLYMEITGVDPTGDKTVIRVKLAPYDSDADLNVSIDRKFTEDDDLFLPIVKLRPTDIHDVKIEFNRCKLVDPE